MTYDCTDDVNEHRRRVKFWIRWVIKALEYAAEHHDDSKLQEPEKSMFDEYTPKLKTLEFGSDEYNAALVGMGEALKHHYQVNTHHPEHFERGIDGMDIIHIVEMICDWMAAASMKNANVDFDYLQNRFSLSDQMRLVITNTMHAADLDAVFMHIPPDVEQISNFVKSKEIE